MSAQTLAGKVAAWSLTQLARAVWALLRLAVRLIVRPIVLVPLVVAVGLLAWVAAAGVPAVLASLAGLAGALVVWRWKHRTSFTLVIGTGLLTAWGRVRYGLVWRWWMGRVGLTLTDERTNKSVRPRLIKVRATADTDSLLIALPAGFTPAKMADHLDDLATAARVGEVRMRRDRPGRVWVDLLTRDPLTRTVPALPIPDIADRSVLASGVQIGVTSHGAPWLLRLVNNNVLIGGMSDSGKGSVLWSTVRAIAPHVRDGYVRLIGLDPKGGMELAWGRAMFSRLCDGPLSEMADLLEAQVAEMQERARRMAGHARTFTPTTLEPLVVIVADELLILTSLAPRSSRRDADRVEAALGALLVEGRAVGYCVIGATQDVRAEKLTLRDFFLTRIALRLSTASQVDMLLGDGARESGALADRIARSTPGIGYVREGDDGDPIRVRATYVTDDDLTAMNASHPTPTPLRPVHGVNNDEGDDSTGVVAA